MCAAGGDDDDGFFDMLSRSQGRRLDDQRCTFVPTNNNKSPSHKGLNNTNELLDILQKLNNRYTAGVEVFCTIYSSYHLTGWRNKKAWSLQHNQLFNHHRNVIPVQVLLLHHPNHLYHQHHHHHWLFLLRLLNLLRTKTSLN